MIALRLLGPLTAWRDGRELALPPGKPSALLARLLLDAGRVVPVEALLEALWGDAPPATASKVLQGYVSELRKTIGREVIATRAPGYSLVTAHADVDLHRFEELTESAAGTEEPRRRVELLRNGLALWSGPALAEFRHEPFAAPAGRRLEELRLAAVERRIEAELDLGEHALRVPELEELVAREPLREPLRALLMLALYRSGRQADALERYREGRRLLARELGLEPGPALQQLERAILRHDLRRDASVPAAAPRGAVVAVGASLGPVLRTLCADGRELVLVELADDERALESAAERLRAAQDDLAALPAVRVASFVSIAPPDDLARLADETGAELIVAGAGVSTRMVTEIAAAAACDVAYAPRPAQGLVPPHPVLVPFGGRREEWAALELGAWLARNAGVALRLVGARASGERRDASRMLASASLALQRFAGARVESALVDPGPEGVLGEPSSAIVVSLPTGELDATRAALVDRATVPVVLVRPGLRPGGIAPGRTLTRFSWSLRDELS